ncbi:unnamed protein product [Diatraea saccharalis]|uniref:Uncharacterized protein n=1 Tax=Diatraea saccharalis TaxID=40085 RepID=A0A9N9R0N9_9NEOP|nr:unnamed protein product [Diatraea saccharalis]
MDRSRLLCDIQHSDSVTRRNFIMFSLKKIDSFLFGETLTETLMTAKSINKSGIELKADPSTKNISKRQKISNQNQLNGKAPGPAYRQPGPSQRSREPAFPRRLPPQGSGRGRNRCRHHHRRPPPSQTQGRRRY